MPEILVLWASSFSMPPVKYKQSNSNAVDCTFGNNMVKLYCIICHFGIILERGKTMKLKSVLRSNHDLKKNGYHVLWKLHKIETRKGASKAYTSTFDDTFFFILGVRALVEIINKEYPEELVFLKRCDSFLSYLDKAAANRQRIDGSILASFLHAYTSFFNRIISTHHIFRFGNDIVELWNTKCLMAYIATWGKNG